MQQLDTERAQAVLFFGTEGIVKELLYTEFEALLDGYVPVSEWAGETRKAVYVEINSDLIAEAAVFFIMRFDKKGEVDRSWNMPLVEMARTVSKGPDLGAGPIHLACQSLCPMSYYKDWMWEPNLKTQSGHFGQIKKALKRNKLGVQFKHEDEEVAGGSFSQIDVKKLEKSLSEQLSKQYDKELKGQMAQLLKDQRLLASTMVSEKDEAVKEVERSLSQQIGSLQSQLDSKSALLKDSLHRNEELKETIDGQAHKIEGLREYYEHKLSRLNNGDQEAVESIAEQHKLELDARVAAATKELNERIKMKELELSYRVEHEAQLKEDLGRLREGTKELMANSGDQLLETLSRKGVNFVTYQPGAGHITIPLSEISRFVENPAEFTADYCGITERHYLTWLKHYQTPVCSAHDESGKICCENVPRVVVPAEFVAGESDCCERHGRSKKSANV